MNIYLLKQKRTMQPLHLFFLFTLSFCASIGGYDETPSKHLITQQQSYQIQQLTENQKKFYQKETQPVRPMR